MNRFVILPEFKMCHQFLSSVILLKNVMLLLVLKIMTWLSDMITKRMEHDTLIYVAKITRTRV